MSIELKHEFKLEFVVSTALVNKVINKLEDSGIKEFTLLDIARGRGNRDGEVSDSRIMATNNVYLFTVCTKEQKDKAVEILGPFFETVGGLFMISEVDCIDP